MPPREITFPDAYALGTIAFKCVRITCVERDEIVRKPSKTLVLWRFVALELGFVGAAYSQVPTEDAQAGSRKIKNRAKPEYSPLARRMNITGAVKIEVLIAPSGKVKRTRVLGGHPLLAVEAERAALECEFETGPKETTQIIEFKFGS
jgi:outer membrane biosynthesis protein TonB